MPLFKKQQKVVDQLYKAYRNKNHISQDFCYVAGEMGVGKTYIASALSKKLDAKSVLIVAPNAVVSKWQRVYKEYTGNDLVLFNPKKPIKASHQIVTIRNLYKWLLFYVTDEEAVSNIHRETRNALNRVDKNSIIWHPAALDLSLKHVDWDTVRLTKKLDYIVFDEIHTFIPKHQEFSAMHALKYCTSAKILGLTGTLFDQNISKLTWLLQGTNPVAIHYALTGCKVRCINTDCIFQTDAENLVANISELYLKVFRYIGVQINLNELNLERNVNVSQNIMPLQGLTMTPEQTAWYKIAIANLSSKHLLSAKAMMNVISYLDLPSANQPIAKHTSRKDGKNIASYEFISMTLKPIKVQDSKKFKQLNNIIQEDPTAKTIIFVQDDNLLMHLSNQLSKCSYLPKSTKKAQVSHALNKLFEANNIVIANSKLVSVGIDLKDVKRVIWYQVPENVSTIIQANRRVLRLSSKEDSQVYFLYYKKTSQEKVIKEVSNSAKNNAALYNVRQDDNLTRLTKILFADLDGVKKDG